MVEELEILEEEVSKISPPPPGGPLTEVEEVIFRRRSVRYYQKKQVPDYLIFRILETGRFAPSAGNCQPWKFIVVQDPTMLAEMTEDVVKFCQKVTRFVNYIDGSARKIYLAKLLQRLRPNDFHPIPFGAMKLIAEGRLGLFHGAPTVILLMGDMRGVGSPHLDIGIAGQNMVLAAHSFGLGTCWVSFVKPLAYLSKWRKRLGIRYPYKLITSVAIGYPRGNPDGFVPRETQAVDWFEEDGTFKIVY